MTDSQLQSILDRLEMLAPQKRFSDKRERLASARERLLALHARGHSWRAIAREISSTGEKVSADLLRSICIPKGKRRGRATRRPGNTALQTAPAMDPRSVLVDSGTDSRFGAKGLKL
jgi:hypothetical protein